MVSDFFGFDFFSAFATVGVVAVASGRAEEIDDAPRSGRLGEMGPDLALQLDDLVELERPGDPTTNAGADRLERHMVRHRPEH